MPTKVRARLLKSALRLFSKRGYDAVGVQEIVVSAKVTKPALYFAPVQSEGYKAAGIINTLR